MASGTGRGTRAGAVALLAALALAVAAAGAGCGGGGAGAPAPPASASGTAQPRDLAGPSVARSDAAAARRHPHLVAPPGAPEASVRVPVLTWHRVVPVTAVGQLDLKVDPAVFTAELDALQRAGYHSITEAQLFTALYHGARLPAKPVLLTFDDGYVDDIRTVLPDLVAHRMVATFFVITGRFGEPGFLTAAQVRRLDRAGMDIGDHTAHHVDLRLLTAAELRTETLGSRRVLQRTVGHFVDTFAYPFGANDATVRAAVHAAGYAMAFTTAGGTTERTSAPLAMPRVHVGRAITPSGLIATLGG